MPALLDIPRRFTTENPEVLRKELDRFAQAVDLFTRSAAETYAPRYLAIPGINPTKLVFGMVGRVTLLDGDELFIQLPPPDRKNFGKRCAVLRTTSAGLVRIVGGQALVGGETQYQLANDLHWVEFLLDDGDYYPTRAGGGFA